LSPTVTLLPPLRYHLTDTPISNSSSTVTVPRKDLAKLDVSLLSPYVVCCVVVVVVVVVVIDAAAVVVVVVVVGY